MKSPRIARGACALALMFSATASVRAANLAVSAPEIETFLDLPAQTLFGAGNGMPVEGSAVQRTFDVQAGDALNFNYSFLTNEALPSGLGTINDFAFVSLVREEVTVIADLFSSFDASSSPFTNETTYRTWTTVLTEAGTYTLKLGVVDTVDAGADSALLIDNVTVGGQALENLGFESGALAGYTSIGDARIVGPAFGVMPTEGSRQLLLTTVPEPSTLMLSGTLLSVSALAAWRRRSPRRMV